MKQMKSFLLVSAILAPVCLGSVAEQGVAAAATPDSDDVPAAAQKGVRAATNRDYRGAKNIKEHQFIRAGQEVFQLPVNLCRLVRWMDGPAGIFRVEHLIGVTEDAVGRPGEYEMVTYVELTLIEDWGIANPANPVVRLPAFGLVELDQGELVGLLLEVPTVDNRNFYHLDSLGVFRRQTHGGFSNGQLFIAGARSAQKIGELVRAIRLGGKKNCAADAEPDSGKLVRSVSQRPAPTHGIGGQGRRRVSPVASSPPAEAHGKRGEAR